MSFVAPTNTGSHPANGVNAGGFGPFPRCRSVEPSVPAEPRPEREGTLPLADVLKAENRAAREAAAIFESQRLHLLHLGSPANPAPSTSGIATYTRPARAITTETHRPIDEPCRTTAPQARREIITRYEQRALARPGSFIDVVV